MLSSVYQTALSGMQAAELAIDATANNLANSMTDGFKSSHVLFAEQAPQSTSAGQVGRGVRVAEVQQDFSQGVISPGGDSFELAIEGDGFFVQQTPDGEYVYSRDGSFSLNADGELVGSNGLRVLGYNSDANFQIDDSSLQSLRPSRGPNENGADLTGITVGEDAVIRGNYADGSIRDLGRVEVARFTNANGLVGRGRNVYAAGPNSGLATSARGARIRAGSRELSNTDIARELVNLHRYATLFRVNAHVLRETTSLEEEFYQLRRT